jgi:hypothetical protein
MGIKFDDTGKQLKLGEVRGGKVSHRKIPVVGRKSPVKLLSLARSILGLEVVNAPQSHQIWHHSGWGTMVNSMGKFSFTFGWWSWPALFGRVVFSSLPRLETDGVLNCAVQSPIPSSGLGYDAASLESSITR